MNKAVEVGNNNNLTRTVKNYADSVVQQAGQAVVEGAKLLQDRIVILSSSILHHFLCELEKLLIDHGCVRLFFCWSRIVQFWLQWNLGSLLLIIEVVYFL